MELRVNKAIKTKTTSLVIRNTACLRRLLIAKRLLPSLCLLGTLVCAVIYLLSDTLGVVNIQGVPSKDYAFGITIAVLGVVLSLFFYIALKALLSNVSGKDINERVDEVLFIAESGIRYVFRIRYHTAPEMRFVVDIPFAYLNGVVYDNSVNKITFSGHISCAVVDNYGTQAAICCRSDTLQEFDIYDYFTPGVLTQLKSLGVYR